MKRWIKDLAIVIDHVDTKTVGAIKEMSAHVQEIIKSTEQANKSTLSITQNFADRAEVLAATTDKVSHAMENITSSLDGQITHIDSVTDDLKTAVGQTGEILKMADDSTMSFNQQMDKLESLLGRYESQTSEFNNRIFNNAEKILTVLKTQGSLLDQEVEKTLHKMAQAQSKVSDDATRLSSVCEDTISHLTDVGTQLTLQTDNLNQVLLETDERVRKLGSISIEEQTKQLMDLSHKAQEHLDRFKTEVSSASTDRFMKDARVVLEHLSMFSIDIAHVFTPKAEEEQWKKYYAGDNGAFMRYLITALPKEKADGFKKLYQENSTLRVAVMRYMSEFDALVLKAKANEKKDVLLPVLIGSDAGRLYMILKQVLGKSLKGSV
jgi:ABC-type transporter Mla subunit MlaD